jgi:hypothetical protein
LRTANKSMRRDKPRQPDPITRVQFTQIGSREKTRYIMPSTTITHRRPAGYIQRINPTAQNQCDTIVKDQDHPDNQHKTCQSTECQKPYSHCQRSEP